MNFENNIKLHGKKRIKLYLSICGVDSNVKEIEHTIKSMFERYSICEPRHELINAIPNIGELAALGIDIRERGFFGRLLSFNWFRTGFIFVAIQMEIYRYQAYMKAKREKDPDAKLKQVRDFIVVPLCTQQRRHIKIDHDAFHCMLIELKIDPKVRASKTHRKRTGSTTKQTTLGQFTGKNTRNHWFEHIDKQKIEQMEKQKKFYHQIDNDVVASVLFENKHRDRNVKPDGYID